jgi:adenosylcobinamide-phosphate guanylyltransferase
MKAVIMAGGKSGRLKLDIEKPLIIIEEKTILERIVNVLNNAGIDEIYVAITDNSPKTKDKAEKLKLKIIHTPGNDYVKDIQYLMRKFKEFLVVSADLPFLQPKLIKNILIKYKDIMQPISVVIPIEKYKKMGFTPSIILNNNYVPIGVNIVSEGEDYFYVIEGKQTININTKKELEMILHERTAKTI